MNPQATAKHVQLLLYGGPFITRKPAPKQTRIGRSLTEFEILTARDMRRNGMPKRQIALHFGVSRWQINEHVGDIKIAAKTHSRR